MTFRVGVLMCLALVGCGAGNVIPGFSAEDDSYAADEHPLARTLVYDCNGYDFVARLGPGEIALWLPDEYVVLSQARSASGTLYEEGDISFWSKGDEAMLTVAGQSHLNCQLQPQRVPWEDARRRGVDFRAVGNEPGWHLEVQNGRQMLLVSDYGLERNLVPDPVASDDGEVRVYKGTTGGREMQVEILEQACADTMSGQQFPYRTVVTFDNTLLEGCGQYLEYPWQDLE